MTFGCNTLVRIIPPGQRTFAGEPIKCRSDSRLMAEGCVGCQEPWDVDYLASTGLISPLEEKVYRSHTP